MGIWRINTLLYEEYNSPADRRVRIETDLKIGSKREFDMIRDALARDDFRAVRTTLLGHLASIKPSRRRRKGGRPTRDDLRRVRTVINAAFAGR